MRKSTIKETSMNPNHASSKVTSLDKKQSRKNNEQKPFSLFPLFIVICSLFFVTCDLLQPKNPNYYQELLDEVAYANAPYADVSIGIISGSLSAAPTEAPHQKVGYKFTVQATANAGYCTAYAELALFKTS